MTNAAEGVKDLLVSNGVGVFNANSGWSIQVSRDRDKPDTQIAVFNTGGDTPNPAYLLDFPSVQVQVRGDQNGYLASRAKAQQVKDKLLGLPSFDLNGDRWVSIRLIGDIVDIGYDGSDRPLHSVNFDLIIEPIAGDNRISL